MDLLFSAFLPPILKHGFAFEAHGQNCLLRLQRVFPCEDKYVFCQNGVYVKVIGFAVRDFGGIKADSNKLQATIGKRLDVLPDNYSDAKSDKEVY